MTSLSDRLKAAQYDRRVAAGLPVDHLERPEPAPEARLDVSPSGDAVIDLTRSWAPAAPTRELHPIDTDRLRRPDPVQAPPAPTSGALPQEGERARVECEQCGGPCQVDLVDPYNQTVSLSCLSCYHMFRAPLES